MGKKFGAIFLVSLCRWICEFSYEINFQLTVFSDLVLENANVFVFHQTLTGATSSNKLGGISAFVVLINFPSYFYAQFWCKFSFSLEICTFRNPQKAFIGNVWCGLRVSVFCKTKFEQIDIRMTLKLKNGRHCTVQLWGAQIRGYEQKTYSSSFSRKSSIGGV